MANDNNKKIKVVIGDNIKRESVMLNSTGGVMAEGQNARQLLSKVYGKRR